MYLDRREKVSDFDGFVVSLFDNLFRFDLFRFFASLFYFYIFLVEVVRLVWVVLI